MRILKSHPVLRMVNSYLIDSPQPSNLSYLWNFGSLLAFCLIIQIITGVTLAMHYNPSVLEAFNSVEHIMRDVNNGWLIRYLHSNTASAFFFLVYLHIGRGLYYGSYRSPRTLTWVIGTIILVVMMATAFLGYKHSPIWLELDLNFFIFINLLLFYISFIIFYLDNFKLSSIYYIKCFQILSSINFLFIIVIVTGNMFNYTDVIVCVNDKDSVDLHGHINVTKEAGKAIGQGISTIGSQMGLGTAMTGIGLAVSKTIAKSSIPPLQKVGIVIGGAMVGGFGHSIISTVNRNAVNMESNLRINSVNSNINKFMDDSSLSSLQTLLYDIEGLNITCLSLVIILSIQIFFKFYLKDSINLNLSNILGTNLNNILEYYINKIINLNKKMSVVYIWLILIILIIGLSFSIYASNELYNNIDSYIVSHNNLKK